MHPKLKAGRIAIYARFSSDSQREASIDDQVRRCREFIAQGGGDPGLAVIFADHAISGSSMDRPRFEQMMKGVDDGSIDVIVTEDLSRISRDFGDSATIFKKLVYKNVPLLGVADGIDTSSKHAKLSFTVKSLVADLYIDDLRDKTLRGLEGRALAGFATGGPPYGYHTVPETDQFGRSVGSRIVIHAGEAEIVRRIFREYRDGGSLTTVARRLNREGIPSPRAGTRHKRMGWGSSTIRAILRNERYTGIWRFKEKQWVKVPGTNKRLPRNRDHSEVITTERPDLRIIDAELWTATAARVQAISDLYTKGVSRAGALRARSNYVLSGLLMCKECGGPMTIIGGSSATYYHCATHRTKGQCKNARSIRENMIRTGVLDAIKTQLTNKGAVSLARSRVADFMTNRSQRVEVEIVERRERVTKARKEMGALMEFIKRGEGSQYVGQNLRELEDYVRAENALIEKLERSGGAPADLPTVDQIAAVAFDLEKRIAQDVDSGRAMLGRLLKGGTLSIGPDENGRHHVLSGLSSGVLFPVLETPENHKPSNHLEGCSPDFVAGAGFEPATFGL